MSQKIKVCVVDDHVETTDVLCEGLRLHDYDAVGVYNGEDALKVCGKGGIDLVLLDVQLPDIDGYEVCKRLRDLPSCRDTAVVFVTGRGEGADVLRGYDLGAIDYITKPYNLPMVMVRVEAAVRNRIVAAQLRASEFNIEDGGYTDSLTGLRNRRYLIERMQEEVDKAHRYNFPVSCVVFDIDDIKALDDETGPVSVDDLLAELALSFRSFTRAYDVLARYDGTLFAALLPHTPLDQALQYAHKILNDIEATTFSDPNFPTKAGMTIGAVECSNGSAKSAEFVFGEAMRSLLQAKGHPARRVVGRVLDDPARQDLAG